MEEIKNIENIYTSKVFNLNKNIKTSEILVILKQNRTEHTIASLTVDENKTIIIDIKDDFKNIYSQEDIEDILIEKLAKK